MNKTYFKQLKLNILLMENQEDNKKRHELDLLRFNRDILDECIKMGIEGIKNFVD